MSQCTELTIAGRKCKRTAVQDGRCPAHLANTCAVCLEETKRSDKRLKCKHYFHFKCIIKWYEESNECPNCRMIQDDDPLIIFKKNIQDNIRLRYRDAIRSLEAENADLRRHR